MAPPTELKLESLKNKFRDGIFTNTVNLDSLGDVFADIGAVHKEEFDKLIFQLTNEGANDYDFQFYGVAEDDEPPAFDDNPDPTPPDFASGKYILLPNGVGTVIGGTNSACTSTDIWTWILIRAKLTGVGLATTGKIFIRGK